MVVFIDFYGLWVHRMNITGQNPIFDVNWRQFLLKVIEKVPFRQFWQLVNFLAKNGNSTTFLWFMVFSIDIWCQWVHWMSIFGQKHIFDVNWRQFRCKMIEKVPFCQIFRNRWPQYHFLMFLRWFLSISDVNECIGCQFYVNTTMKKT